jgi:hypothetical protein
MDIGNFVEGVHWHSGLLFFVESRGSEAFGKRHKWRVQRTRVIKYLRLLVSFFLSACVSARQAEKGDTVSQEIIQGREVF